jgi:tetratricopeptide (TPR) repeat protein
MNWQRTEFILKGIYLGLLVFIALLKPPTWVELAYVGLCILGGLVIFVGIAALKKLREGYRPRGRPVAFLLFLLLENPGLVYAGVLSGLVGGAVLLQDLLERQDQEANLFYTVLGGALLGAIFYVLRSIKDRRNRLWLALALAVVLVACAVWKLPELPDLQSKHDRGMLGYLLLLGIPPFYLLTFASLVEESEIEIATICAALGISLYFLGEQFSQGGPTGQGIALIVPLGLYFLYTMRILPGLRVFKHVLRGISYASVGRFRWALLSLGRALQLDPRNRLAKEELWDVHRQMDFEQIASDPETLSLVNFEMCVDRAGSLLLNPPRPDQLHEATRLMNLVSSQRPEMLPRCDYWRAVASIHQRQYEKAAEHLEKVIAALDSDSENAHRWKVLMQAWQLALTHPEMKRRVGLPQLTLPGRRMEAIAAVERRLTTDPQNTDAWELKQPLYADLTEADYDSLAGPDQAVRFFDYRYVQELGMALLNDATHWRRGLEYLRLAARGMPEHAPSLYVRMAKTSEKMGDYRGAWDNYEVAKRAGKAVGPKNLAAEDREMYFQVVRMLADSRQKEGKIDEALENFKLYTEYEKAGRETYRSLTDLYERKEDAWSALHALEHALSYPGAADPDLLERKDRYYYSVTPQELKERWEAVHKWFDIDYCIRKARTLLEKHSDDLELAAWASHLLDLVRVAQPANVTVRLLLARVHRLRGEIPEAITMLEEIRQNKPERFGSSDEQESWYAACKILGDLYLNDKPELALECFQEYRNSAKSGADTWYKMGQCYEALGDWARAAKCYQQVTGYTSHPLAPAAHDALDRLRTASG